jgi:RNA polymerase sigma-70 factor, ECF subfamily
MLGDADLEGHRPYLRLLARMSLDPRWQPRIDCSDLVQETLLQAHQCRKQYRGSSPAELAGWLRSILARKLLNAVRDLQRARRDVGRERSLDAALEQSSALLDGWLAADQSAPDRRAEARDEGLRLAAALETLPEAQREAVTLHHLHRWTLQDVAAYLGRTPAAAAGLIKRGLQALRAHLAAHDTAAP